MSANVDAMARLGYLYLNGGNWNGRQIVSRAHVDLSTKSYYSRIPISMLRQYGLLWWNNNSGYLAGVPRDAYWSTGKNNNHTLVVPSLNLVAVRIGIDGWSNHGGNHAQFFKPICDAVVA
jgi:CubicO group peptidase (beta-lactamase class C family)